MRNFLAGFAVLSSLAIGMMAPAMAYPLSVPPAGQAPVIQQAEWDGCGPRCWEYRREAWERQRWAQHRRWEEHRRWQEGRQYPYSGYGYQYRY